MTNTQLLKDAIKQSGYKKKYIAQELGLKSYQGFKNKLDGRTEFLTSEVKKLSVLLKLDTKQMGQIFFGK